MLAVAMKLNPIPATAFLTLSALALAASFAGPRAAAADADERVLLPAAKQAPGSWRYTVDEPPADWFAPGFDDAAWMEGPGGFGTAKTPNTRVGTTWDTKAIWLRRAFVLDGPVDGEVYALLHHDEDTAVYLNGVLAATASWYTTDFERIPVEPAAAASLRPGTNTVAVQCRQTYGGQYIDLGLIAARERRWPRQKAWAWYDGQPWPCGFNYVPAHAISYTEMWMPYNFDPARIDRELALAQEVGFNALRVVLPFVVWEHDPAAFRQRLDAFLDVCARRGLRVMFALFDDCHFGSDEALRDPFYGRQPAVLEGWYASGWTPSPGHATVRDPSAWPRLERYVRDVVGAFKDNPRVWVWDLYNEPCNGGVGDAAIPLVDRVFTWARDVAPSQPLTVGQYSGHARLNELIFRRSDIITFHDYDPADALERHIAALKKFGRPVINTEWLNRGRGSKVETCLPVFARARVGALHWGLVNGKTQTHLHWGWRPGMGEPDVWQHDLYRGDFTPYAPAELALFRQTIRALTAPKE